MPKAWVITREPQDLFGQRETIDQISNRKKIAQVEEHLCALYRELASDDADPSESIHRESGLVTTLNKPPFVLSARLIDM